MQGRRRPSDKIILNDLYPKGIVVPDEEMAALNIVRTEFHGEWNYTIRSGNRSDRAVAS
ncbi:MAG: hypothetical protein QOD93_2037 [Acetobacteraceae bacterium]|nr:hypothetical protein [Acetobacteraceae bacterium]